MWLEPLSAEQAPPAVQDLYEKVRQQYGAVLDPITAMAHNIEVLGAYLDFERGMHETRHLPKKLSQLVNLYVAKRLECPFCVDIGEPADRSILAAKSSWLQSASESPFVNHALCFIQDDEGIARLREQTFTRIDRRGVRECTVNDLGEYRATLEEVFGLHLPPEPLRKLWSTITRRAARRAVALQAR